MKNLKKALAIMLSIMMLLSIMPVNTVWASELFPENVPPVESEPENECPHNKVTLDNYSAPSCEESGYSGDLCCTVCGAVQEKGESLPAIGHDFAEKEIISAFCIAEETVELCKNCGVVETTFDMTGEHNLGPAYAEIVTCTLGTFEIRDCADCDLSVATKISDASTGHSYVDGVCESCDMKEISDYDYGYVESWGGIVIYNYSGNDNVLEIPSEIEGLPVRMLGPSSFSGCKAEQITVPDSVLEIGPLAFAECGNLKAVSVGENAFFLGAAAFQYDECLSIVEFTGDLAYIPEGCFEECYFLERVNLPEGLRFIAEHAFSLAAIEEIDIPDSVYSIGRYAFYHCFALNEIVLPESLVTLCEAAFACCYNVTSIELNDNLETIGMGAFAEMYCLETLTLPSSLKEIKSMAFLACMNLAYVIIPESLKEIGYAAFAGTENLWHVLYEGSEAEFAAMEIGAWNSSLEDCAGHCDFVSSDSPVAVGEEVEATCSMNGYTKLVCSICEDDSFGRFNYKERLPHSIENAEIHEHYEANCHRGEHLWCICGDCGEYFTHDLSEPLNHIGEFIADVPASCTEGAYSIYRCTRESCGEEYHVYDENSKELGHDGTYVESYNTCSWGEIERYSCTRCNGYFAAAPENGKPHNFVDGVCTGCNSPERIEDYDYYIRDSIGGIMITGYYGSAEVISIPEVIEGIPVKGIETGAFADNTASGIILPDGLTYIGSRAFANTDFTEVIIPESVEEMGESIFESCGSLEKVTLPSGLTEIPDGTFNNCLSLKNITLPAGLTAIGDEAFRFCVALESIDCPDTVTAIGEYAFSDCVSLTAVSLPDSLEELGEYAFAWCSCLGEVALPDGLEKIAAYAFAYCYRLSLVYIPESVKEIAYAAFAGTQEIAHIWYGGTEQQYYETAVDYQEGSAFDWTTVHFECEAADYTVVSTKAPDCMESGYSVIRCNVCEEEFTALFREQTAHNGTVTETVYATCTYDGYYVMTCQDCGEVYEHTFEAALGHVIEGAEPIGTSCSFGEISKGVCSVCETENYVFTDENYGCHNFEEGVCTECGVSDELDYYFNSALGGIVIEGYRGDSSTLTIPAVIERIPVIAVSGIHNDSVKHVIISEGVEGLENYAFNENAELESVTLPSTITYIGEACFENCYKLTEINLPEGLEEICERTFLCCYSLSEIDIPDSVKYIGANAFNTCTSLMEITLPASLTEIGSYAFISCEKLKRVDMADAVTTIGEAAFAGCESLSEITLPEALTKLGRCAFEGCSSIEELTVPSGVTHILDNTFNNCIKLNKLTLSQGLESIGENAFANCRMLLSVEIPDTVTSIGEYAFAYCDFLYELILGASVAVIGDYAFRSCGNLGLMFIPDSVEELGVYAFDDSCFWHVYTSFSEAEFKEIFFGSGNENIFYGSTVFHYEVDEASYESEDTVESTCVENGRRQYTCTLCDGEEGTIFEVMLPLADHNGVYKSTVSATCTKGGYDVYVCSECEEEYFMNEVPNKGHQAGEFEYSVTAPCTIGRMDVYDCTECDEYCYVNMGDGANGGHLFDEDGKCTECGLYWYFNECYSFNDSLGGIIIYSYSGDETHLVIPETIEGIPVVAIDSGAFRYASMTEITLPDTIKTIYSEAFNSCNNLKKITLPDGLTEIPDSCFSECHSLEEAALPEGLEKIGNYVFSGCSRLNKINIPDSVTYIGEAAFAGCKALRAIELPDGITRISNTLFSECKALNSISVPDSVTVIGDGAFTGCNNLRTVTLPEGLIEIGANAFTNCAALSDITLPETLKTIGSDAFVCCNALDKIVIPASVTDIGRWAFQWTNGLDYLEVHCEVIPSDVFSNSSVRFLYLGENVKVIEPNAFENSYISHVSTALSEEEFEAVLIDESNYGALPLEESICYGADEASYTVSVIEAATCTRGGQETVICDNCDNETELYTNALEHVVSEGVDSFTSCTWGNVTTFVCERCNDTCYSLEHNGYDHCFNEDGYCEKCGVDARFTYNFDSELGGIVIDGYEGASGFLSIPDYIENIRVVSIGGSAFEGSEISSIKLPAYLKAIAGSAFRNCRALTEIVIPEGVVSIGESAFAVCNSLKEIVIPEGVRTISTSTFSDCDSLEKVELPEGLAEIENHAFSGCRSLKSITLPEGLAALGEYAFARCSNLAEINIPSSIEEIPEGFLCDNNVLSVLEIPEGIRVIGNYAFTNSQAIRVLYIPASVEVIGEAAFNCESAVHIFYEGTPEEFENVSILGQNYIFRNEDTVIHYESGPDITVKGKLDADCTHAAAVTYVCNVCDAEISATEGSALGHEFTDNICERCGLSYYETIKTPHDFYDNNASLSWTIHKEGSAFVAVTFHENTYTEEDYDVINIYRGDELVGSYSGAALAGQRIEVEGDTLVINFTSDGSVNEFYGFSLVKIEFDDEIYIADEEDEGDEPSTEEPSTEEPSTEEPSTEEPSTEEPSTEEPSTEEPSTEEPSTEEPSTEEPSTEEPSTEEPSTEEPSTEEPSTEEPSTEEPSTEEPSSEEPSSEEPSEPQGCAHENVQIYEDKQASCDDFGCDYAVFCYDCKEFIIKDNFVDALSHDYSAQVVDMRYLVTGATCSTYASYFLSCTRCEEASFDPALRFWYAEGGYAADVHESEVTTLKNSINATCKTPGYTGDLVYECCDAVHTAGAATEINEANHESSQTVLAGESAATCVTPGYTGDLVYVCCGCVSEYGESTGLNAENHEELYTYGKQEAWCTIGGYDSLTVCLWCQATIAVENPVPALDHDFTEELMFNEYQLSSASCTSYATYFRSCTRCGESSNDPENVFFDEKSGFYHENTETLGKKEATCTEGGYDSLTYCIDCDAVISMENPTGPVAHKFTEKVTDDKYLILPANCSTYALYYCSCVCGEKADSANDIFYDEDGGYNPDRHANPTLKQINTVVGTCKTPGYSGDHLYECCNTIARYGENTGLVPSRHEGAADVTKNAAEATCSTPGYTGDVHYSCCDALYKAGEQIEADASVHEASAVKINVTEATCSTPGYTGDDFYSCCKTVIRNGVTLSIDAANHEGVADVTKNAAAATCKTPGYTGDVYYSCCDALYAKGSATEISSSNHESAVTKLINEKPATCKTAGYTGDLVYECCGAIKENGTSVAADASKHEGTASVIKNKKAATCTEKGYTGDTYYSCCSALAAKGSTTPVDASKHTSTQTTITGTKAATCTVNGYTGDKVYTCCKAVVAKGSVIAATGHKWGAFITVTEATTEKEGKQVRTCSECKAQESKSVPRIEKIEIVETEQIKVSEALPDVYVAEKVTAEDIIEVIPEGAQLVNKEGEAVSADEPVGTGMKIVIKDGGKIIDEKVIVVPFDVDGDAEATAADARLALRQSVSLENLEDYQKAAADVSERTSTTTVTAADARLILRASVGLEDKDEWFRENV